MIEGNMSLEDFKSCEGKELEPSGWLLVDQARIDQFADATNDRQFIHIDPDRAATTPFGSTIAHGFLTLSLLSYLMGQHMPIPYGTTMGINYGSNKVRFLQPVKVNSRVRARTRIDSISERAGHQFLVKSTVSVEIENESRPALIAEILSLYIVGAHD